MMKWLIALAASLAAALAIAVTGGLYLLFTYVTGGAAPPSPLGMDLSAGVSRMPVELLIPLAILHAILILSFKSNESKMGAMRNFAAYNLGWAAIEYLSPLPVSSYWLIHFPEATITAYVIPLVLGSILATPVAWKTNLARRLMVVLGLVILIAVLGYIAVFKDETRTASGQARVAVEQAVLDNKLRPILDELAVINDIEPEDMTDEHLERIDELKAMERTIRDEHSPKLGIPSDFKWTSTWSLAEWYDEHKIPLWGFFALIAAIFLSYRNRRTN